MTGRPGGEHGKLPSRETLRRFISESPGRVGKREIARAFGLTAGQKAELRVLLAELKGDGAIAPAGHRRFTAPGRVPEATVVKITGIDQDGEAIGRPIDWPGGEAPPVVFMRPERRDQPGLVPGERVLAQLMRIGAGKYEGRTLRRLTDAPGTILGLFEPRAGGSGRIVPTDRRVKAEWQVPEGEENGAESGEIVLAMPLPHRGVGLKPARVVKRLGRLGDAKSVSLIVIHSLEIPSLFPQEALDEAEATDAAMLGQREDLRALPLVTIDGEDARDFDDAVWAEPDGDGHRLVVAIADVANYVRPGSALDREARLRGNSVYFPDRVVPMLPEALSNGWCSLKPSEDRPCLFAELRIDAEGRKLSHRFGRGLMRSAARLTYEQVQASPDDWQALYGAFRALLGARRARGTLDLDLPERQVVLRDGRVEQVRERARLDSHRLVEEFMILANVAAAEELERLHRPCIYRVHAPPSDSKLEALRDFLHGFGIGLPAGNQVHPRDLERVLARVRGTAEQALVNDVILRSQSQAEYAPANIGHFGLALSRYAHFTSPIRRYADLLVHRALLGELEPADSAGLEDLARRITATERRASQAERDALDRYLASYLAARVGLTFPARVSGVQRFGIFVTLRENGATGLVPTGGLPDDLWIYDDKSQTLSGRHTRMTFRLSQDLDVRLTEANALTGGLVFDIQAMAFPVRRP